MPKRRHARPPGSLPQGDDPAIDALYGLEPVFEPGHSSTGVLSEFVDVACPYCNETFGTSVDLSAGTCAYIEDCQICCQPISIGVVITAVGGLDSVTADRLD